jgi:hypothetical protein
VHLTIVRELTRLAATDTQLHEAIAADKSLARAFQLDALIAFKDPAVQKVGAVMGALLISKIDSLELVDVVGTEYSMEKVTQ